MEWEENEPSYSHCFKWQLETSLTTFLHKWNRKYSLTLTQKPYLWNYMFVKIYGVKEHWKKFEILASFYRREDKSTKRLRFLPSVIQLVSNRMELKFKLPDYLLLVINSSVLRENEGIKSYDFYNPSNNYLEGCFVF